MEPSFLPVYILWGIILSLIVIGILYIIARNYNGTKKLTGITVIKNKRDAIVKPQDIINLLGMLGLCIGPAYCYFVFPREWQEMVKIARDDFFVMATFIIFVICVVGVVGIYILKFIIDIFAAITSLDNIKNLKIDSIKKYIEIQHNIGFSRIKFEEIRSFEVIINTLSVPNVRPGNIKAGARFGGVVGAVSSVTASEDICLVQEIEIIIKTKADKKIYISTLGNAFVDGNSYGLLREIAQYRTMINKFSYRFRGPANQDIKKLFE